MFYPFIYKKQEKKQKILPLYINIEKPLKIKKEEEIKKQDKEPIIIQII